MTLPTNLRMFYKRQGGIVEYTISPDPAEATFWSTYRLKKADVRLVVKLDRAMSSQIREEIMYDILSREPNPSKKSTTSNDEVSQRRQSPQPIHVKTRKAK